LVTDPIGDMLIRLKNAQMARRDTVYIPGSHIKENILRLLQKEGFIGHFSEENEGNKKFFEVSLKYIGRYQGMIKGTERVSKPGRRVYVRIDGLKKKVGMRAGLWIVNTSKGVLTHMEALERRAGGEILLRIW